MNHYDNRTAELHRVPETMAERVPPPRPHADYGDSAPYPYPYPEPYPYPPRPRFTPRIQYTPRTQSPPPPEFRPSPEFRSPPTLPQPALYQRRPLRQPPRQYQQWPERAVIGDALRVPILWCEFGDCIERYTDVNALGERDLRSRALWAGWRYDLLGRLACPSCLQHDPTFWMTRPPVPVRQY